MKKIICFIMAVSMLFYSAAFADFEFNKPTYPPGWHPMNGAGSGFKADMQVKSSIGIKGGNAVESRAAGGLIVAFGAILAGCGLALTGLFAEIIHLISAKKTIIGGSGVTTFSAKNSRARPRIGGLRNLSVKRGMRMRSFRFSAPSIGR